MDVSRRSARRATAATSTAAARSTTRTTSPPALMTMLLLKRLNVPLDRDVIFVVGGGRGRRLRTSASQLHGQRSTFRRSTPSTASPKAAASRRIGGEAKYATVQTLEKIPRGIELVVARHLRARIDSAEVERDRPPRRRGREGRRVAAATSASTKPPAPTSASWRRSRRPTSRSTTATCCRPIRRCSAAADDWLLENEPRHSSMLRTSVSPNIFTGGYRSNVIPSEAKATLDVRALPDEDPAKFLEQVKKVVNDPAVDVRFTGADRSGRPAPTRSSTPRPSRRSTRPARASTTRRRCRR